MLIQFRFQNFRSFRDDTILDLTATKITDHGETVVSLGKERLLPVSAIFGANASGKSNVIGAFRLMRRYVLDSFSYGGETELPELTPFLFDRESRDADSSFEVYFIDENQKCRTYNYGFTLGRDGIREEWLNVKAKTAKNYKCIFYRDEQEQDFSGISEKLRENILVSLQKENLAVSLGAKLNVPELQYIRNWFADTEIADFGNPVENMARSLVIPAHFEQDPAIQAQVVRYLSTFDPSIVGFRVETLKAEGKKQFKIYARHCMTDGELTDLPMRQESDGTLKMFALYTPMATVLQKGGALFVDELNARLHPLLVRNIILTFQNPELNPNHAQLIFTTHDSWQLSNELLRRDEIWFAEKDGNGVSTLYSLADFTDEDGDKIRKDESFGKNYLYGKYGAIPHLHKMDFMKGE